MTRLKFVFVLVFSLMLASSSTALASGGKTQPWSYDPNGLNCGTGAWVTHEGLPDAGKSNHALVVTKECPTSSEAAGGATVSGFSGQTLTSLGFDIRDDSYCGAGAPRFNVSTTDGVTHFFGCVYGVHSPAASGWTHVAFAPGDAFPPVGPSDIIDAIEIVMDEEGTAVLDNIEVNGVVMGKPGNAK